MKDNFMIISEFIKVLEIWIVKFEDTEINFTNEGDYYAIDIEKLEKILPCTQKVQKQ